MPKTKLSDILKNGDNFQITSLSDIKKEDLKSMLKAIEEEKKKVREQMKKNKRR